MCCIFSYFNKSSLPLLIKQDYTNKPNLIAALLDYDKDIITMFDRIDLCVLYMKHDIAAKLHVLEGCNFSLNQLDKLGQQLPKLWNTLFIITSRMQ